MILYGYMHVTWLKQAQPGEASAQNTLYRNTAIGSPTPSFWIWFSFPRAASNAAKRISMLAFDPTNRSLPNTRGTQRSPVSFRMVDPIKGARLADAHLRREKNVDSKTEGVLNSLHLDRGVPWHSHIARKFPTLLSNHDLPMSKMDPHPKQSEPPTSSNTVQATPAARLRKCSSCFWRRLPGRT